MPDAKAISEFAIASYAELAAREFLDTGAMHAARVPGRQDVFFAVSALDEFYLLIKLRETVLVSETRLNAIRISAGFEYQLSEAHPATPSRGQFATVVLESGSIGLLTAFGSMAGILLASLAESPNAAEVETFLNDFLELFAPRRTMGRSEIVGLWGELWLIRSSPDVARFASGWHLEPSSKFDFSLPPYLLEVKTTEGDTRTHHFSLAQLVTKDRPIFIASIAIKPDAAGISVAALLAEILGSVPLLERPKMARKTLAVLGGDLEAAEDFRFSAVGDDSIAVVAADEIPRVEVPANAPISQVNFVVDITTQVNGSTLKLNTL